MSTELGKNSEPCEWVVICRVPNEESAYLYFFLELFEGIFNYSTLDHQEGSRTRDLVAITNQSLLDEAKNLIDDLKETLRLEIVKDWHPAGPGYQVK